MMAACTNSETSIEVNIVPQPSQMTVKGALSPCTTYITKIDESLQPEEYTLVAKKGKVTITGGSDAGVFYGERTLDQIRGQFGGQVDERHGVHDRAALVGVEILIADSDSEQHLQRVCKCRSESLRSQDAVK
mgnify:CR=1 FL=1